MDKIEVTQADREAAAVGYYDWVSATQTVPNRMQAGEADFHSMVQAFARHRLATRTDATPVARKQFPILGSRGAKIDLQLVEDHGKQAYSNHYQTVERLAERGGLSWCELHAVLNDRAWQKMDGNTAIAECRAIETRYLGAFNPPANDVAALVDAAKDLRDAIAHMAAPARVDPDKYFSEQVKAFGDAFGYGALMTTASALWRQSLGDLQGGEFAVGPCVTTAANQLNRLSAALAPFTKGQP